MSIMSWLMYACMLVSALIAHEIGHGLQMAQANIPIKEYALGIGPRLKIFGRFHLGLFPIGASVTPDPVAWSNAKPLQRFMVAIAGPMTSFVCGLVFLALSLIFPHGMRGLSAFAQLHFLLGAANLVPVPPLDGWVAFTELFGVRGRPLSARAHRLASRVGSGVLYGLGFWFVGDLLHRIP